jgi:hypothetical protein
MSLFKYFEPISSLPTSQQTGLSELTTSEANKSVQKVLEKKKLGEK